MTGRAAGGRAHIWPGARSSRAEKDLEEPSSSWWSTTQPTWEQEGDKPQTMVRKRKFKKTLRKKVEAAEMKTGAWDHKWELKFARTVLRKVRPPGSGAIRLAQWRARSGRSLAGLRRAVLFQEAALVRAPRLAGRRAASLLPAWTREAR